MRLQGGLQSGPYIQNKQHETKVLNEKWELQYSTMKGMEDAASSRMEAPTRNDGCRPNILKRINVRLYSRMR